MKIKITLLFCLLTTLMYSQYGWNDGEIILKNGEVLKGQVRLTMISKNYITYNAKDKVRFRKDKKSKKVKYNENDVSKVIIRILDLKPYVYEYVQVSKKRKELFYIMVSGKVTLYCREVQTSRPNEANVGPNYLSGSEYEFYVLREGEPIASPLVTARISRSFKVRAIEYFSDCPSLVSKLENKVLKERDIEEIVEEYNNCD